MASSEPRALHTTGLIGRAWLSPAIVRVIQATWLLLVAATVALVVAMTPAVYADFQVTCHEQICDRLPQPNEHTVAQLERLGISLEHYAVAMVTVEWLFVLLCIAPSAAIIWKRPRDRVGLLVAFSLVVVSASNFLRALDRSDPANDAVVRTGLLISWVTLPLFIALFPDGRWVPRWTRWVVVLDIALAGYEAFSDPPHPWLLDALLGLRSLVVLGILLAAQIYRYRNISTSAQRQQAKWLLLALGLLVGVIVSVAAAFTVGIAERYQLLILFVAYGGEVLLFVAITLAILRYRLFDVDIIINRALVYGALTVSVAGIYALIVGGVGALLQGRGVGLSFVAAGVLALVFQPVRNWLQRGVNRLLYGERDEPYAVLVSLGRRLEVSLDPDTVLPTIVQTVASALRLPYVAITLNQGPAASVAAAHGTQPSAGTDIIPLVYRGEPVGQFVVAPRAGEAELSTADRRLLHDLAHQAGVATHAVSLNAALQRSREQIVSAREEERRRLRRDLHDGLGPALASQALTISTARLLVERDPQAAATLLQEAEEQCNAAVQEIRRVVHALRPTALDDLGLTGALQELASRFTSASMSVTFVTPESLPLLPAATEVAAYRITQEALANVARHAEAESCTITLAVDEHLQLTICDDGRGLSANRSVGVGLGSMRERAEELGGTCLVKPGDTGGTRVVAHLPI